MSNSYLTTANVLKLGDDQDVGIVSAVLAGSPLLNVMPARAVPGIEYSYLRKTVNPTAGFRAVNTGLENSTGTKIRVPVSLKILDASFALDKAVADADIRGREVAIAEESKDHLESGMFTGEGQILYGTDSTNGFDGIATVLADLGNPHVIDAGGTAGSGDSEATSVFFIRFGDQDVHVLWGKNGELVIGDPVVQRIDDGTGKFYTGYYVDISAWMGLQIGSDLSVVRICNITQEQGHTMNDDLAAAALSLFPAGKGPNAVVMSRRSRYQIQTSRTAVNPTGAPAPIPTDLFGVPVIVSEAVSNAETIVTQPAPEE